LGIPARMVVGYVEIEKFLPDERHLCFTSFHHSRIHAF
jgi:hypothetical protein